MENSKLMQSEKELNSECFIKRPKMPNQIGEMYLNADKSVQNLFLSYLNTYGKMHNIKTNLSQQFREVEMFRPISNLRASVYVAASAVFNVSYDFNLNSMVPAQPKAEIIS